VSARSSGCEYPEYADVVVLGVPRRRRYISAFSETLALTVIQVRTRKGYSQGVLTGYSRSCARGAHGVLKGYSRVLPAGTHTVLTHGVPCPQAKGVAPLVDALVREPEDHIKSASAWSLGQIGRCVSAHDKYPLSTLAWVLKSTRDGAGTRPTMPRRSRCRTSSRSCSR
jgi:hypothetical protein